jgi:hypothetical protein
LKDASSVSWTEGVEKMNATPVLPGCLTVDELSRYYAGDMSEERIEQIDRHLLECDFCYALAERVADTTREVLEHQLESPATATLAFLEKASRESLELTAVVDLQDRVQDWIRTGAEIAVRVVLPFAGKVTAFTVSGLEALVGPGSQFNLQEASVGAFLGVGDSATSALEGPILEIPGVGRRRARVVVDVTETTRVSIQLDNLPATIRTPLAAVQVKDDGRTYVKEMMRSESISGDPSLIDVTADFNLPIATREILVLLEPFTP